MTRDEALDEVVADEVSRLTRIERESLLLDWWSIDSDDEEFGALPEPLREQLEKDDGPTEDPMGDQYLPLLSIGIRWRLVGVRNQWLSARVGRIRGTAVEVVGPVEVLQRCPCCLYLTLRDRGSYSICRLCYWEDDGNEDGSRYSSANRMLLADGRANVERIGVSDERFRDKVPVDGMERYEYGGE